MAWFSSWNFSQEYSQSFKCNKRLCVCQTWLIELNLLTLILLVCITLKSRTFFLTKIKTFSFFFLLFINKKKIESFYLIRKKILLVLQKFNYFKISWGIGQWSFLLRQNNSKVILLYLLAHKGKLFKQLLLFLNWHKKMFLLNLQVWITADFCFKFPENIFSIKTKFNLNSYKRIPSELFVLLIKDNPVSVDFYGTDD